MPEALRILVVDDMKTAREILLLSLSQIGVIDLKEACNGREALEVLAAEETDLVISDLHMPDMDGLELYRQLKKSDRLDKVQFILATGDDTLVDLPQSYRLGRHLMLRKPFDRYDLLNCLGEAKLRRFTGADVPSRDRPRQERSA